MLAKKVNFFGRLLKYSIEPKDSRTSLQTGTRRWEVIGCRVKYGCNIVNDVISGYLIVQTPSTE